MLKPSPIVSKYHKVMVMGLRNTGKSCILQQLIYSNDPVGNNSNVNRQGVHESHIDHETIEDIYSAVIENEEKGCKEKVHFFETPGIQSIQSLNPESLRHYVNVADAFVLVYSIDKRESFSVVELIKRNIDKMKEKRDVPILVLGNKLDSYRFRQVDRAEAESFAAREKIRLVEVTSIDRQTLIEPFVYLTSRLSPSVNKSSFSKHAAKRGSTLTIDL